MRFSHNTLPPSRWIDRREDVVSLAEQIGSIQEPYGFDLETDGLGYVCTGDDTDVEDSDSGRPARGNFAGDGLGANLHVICLSFGHQRIGVPTYGPYVENLAILAPALRDSAQWQVGYNWIFDANVLEYNVWDKLGWRDYELTSLCLDGLRLWNLWDEDGEHTSRGRGLKDRAPFWVGLPMNDFETIIRSEGTIGDALERDDLRDRARDYCTRDAYAHLQLGLKGIDIAKQFLWCRTCSICGQPAMQYDPQEDRYWCKEHGWTRGTDRLSMWDWHQIMDRPFLVLLKRMEQRGLLIDLQPLQEASVPLNQYADSLEATFQRQCADALLARGGNPWPIKMNSSPQLVRFYHESKDRSTGEIVGLGIPHNRRTKSGNLAGDKRHIESLVLNPAAVGANLILQTRAIRKITSTYVEGMGGKVWNKTKRIHTRIRPDATTGRLISANPNMVNLPTKPVVVTLPPAIPPPDEAEYAETYGITVEEAREALKDPVYQPVVMSIDIRNSVVAGEGNLLCCADYGQLEMRLTATLSGDETMCRIINEGMDMHSYTAYRVYESRCEGLTYESIAETQEVKDRDLTRRLGHLRSILAEGISGVPDIARGLVSGEAGMQERLDSLAEVSRWIEGDDTAQGVLGDAWELDAKAWAEAVVSVLPDPLLSGLLSSLGVFDKRNKLFRTAAKAVGFGIIYQIGPRKLAEQVTIATGQPFSPQEAKEFIAMYLNDLFPGVGAMTRRLISTVQTHGYVRTLAGRYRHPAGVFSADGGQRARVMRQAGNSPIQGTAMDIMQNVMLFLENDPFMQEKRARLVLQIHDELLVECPEAHASDVLARMKWAMSTQHGLYTPVPLDASGAYGRSWGEAK
jgi:DNA polymerase I-like protein with 3'-5' exonuclease and polymerase domains